MKLIGIVALAGSIGCSSLYPKVLDSPEMQEAIVEAVRESTKTWEIDGQINNPEVQAYYMIGVGARVIGVNGRMGARGAGGPTCEPAR